MKFQQNILAHPFNFHFVKGQQGKQVISVSMRTSTGGDNLFWV